MLQAVISQSTHNSEKFHTKVSYKSCMAWKRSNNIDIN